MNHVTTQRQDDIPLGEILTCPHISKHRHGTTLGYTSCRCRCTPCVEAAARDRAANRQRAADGTLPSHGKAKRVRPNPEDADEGCRGTWIAAEPQVSREIARAAAATVASIVTDREAFDEIVGILGIRELVS